VIDMTRTKTWFLSALLTLLAMVLAAAGCGGNDNKSKTTSASGFKTKTAGTLTVGSDIPYTPFELGRSGSYKGFDVDVVNEIGKRIGLKVKFVKTPFPTIFRDLAQGKFDMVASATTITPERAKEVDFSSSYFPADQSLMVKQGSPVKSTADLKGKIVGAQTGTTGADYAKKKSGAKTVRTYEQIDDAFNALEAGQVAGVINDCPVSKYAERSHKDLAVVQAIQTNELYGFAFRKGSDALRNAANKQIAQLKKNGGLARISLKWLGSKPCELHG
jgi:polar amino acid transport system substrate-binding protein